MDIFTETQVAIDKLFAMDAGPERDAHRAEVTRLMEQRNRARNIARRDVYPEDAFITDDWTQDNGGFQL